MLARRTVLVFSLIGITLLTAPVLAREDGASIAALGMSDAVRSNASGISGLYFNPAGMSQLFVYSLESGYTFDNMMSGHVFNASIVDSATNKNFGLGFGYSYIKTKLDGDSRDGHSLRFGLSTGYRSKKWAVYVGASLRYLRLQYDKHYKLDALAVDLGALLVFKFGLRIGVVGYNLTSVKNKEELPRMLGTGISYGYKDFVIAMDALVDFQSKGKAKVMWSWGLEYLVKKLVVARAGFQLDNVNNRKLLSIGTGFITRYVGMDLAYQQDISNKRGYVLGATIKGYLP